MNAAFRAYLRTLRGTRASGQATEHSYRPALETLIQATGGKGVRAINEPTQGEYGAPDFIVLRDDVPVGHIECKNIGVSLDAAEQSPQLQRYRDALPNLILTDYVEFRWYVNGECRATATLASAGDDKLRAMPNAEITVGTLWGEFFNTDAASISNPAELAQRMAGKARLLRKHLCGILAQDDDDVAPLRQLLASYRKVLISELSPDGFADLQAQTVAYGLFAARWLHDGAPADFTRQSAIFAQTTPFLRDVFGRVAGPTADPRITWIVDDLARLLARAPIAEILEDFGRRTQQKDPIVHFYEDFLAVYDPKLKERRGVFYTPEPVVSYIVRSVDKLLRNEFGLTDGLADTATIETKSENGDTRTSPRVLILDPAAGTGSFLSETVSVIRADLEQRGLGGAWPEYVNKHLLPRLFGFELLMAPYAIAHLKLAIAIGDDPRQFMMPTGERLNIFLTNSLEAAHEDATGAMFSAEIAHEARQADAVKRDHPVMVVIGNPPYSGHSANNGKWIKDLIHGKIEGSPADYFSVDGAPLGEQNPKWVNNDYVKFIRFAQWRIERTGEGILAFVTSNSYLDSPTFRGVRRSLMTSFSELYLLDLHGNSKKLERGPDGEPDENVFDITEGVVIGIFVRRAESDGRPARILHHDLRGRRGSENSPGKYRWLSEHDVESTSWNELAPRPSQYLFVPQDDTLSTEYEAGWQLTDAFPVNALGFQSHRDRFAIAHTKEEVMSRLEDMRNEAIDDQTLRSRYKLRDNRDWQLARARAALQLAGASANELIIRCCYRALDDRWCFYGKEFMDYPRRELMENVAGQENICLNIARQTKAADWRHALVSDAPSSAVFLEVKDGSSVLPLYLYPESSDALDLDIPDRTPNLAPEFVAELAAALNLEFTPDGRGDLDASFGPEDVIHYIYAILHSPEYRRRYADFLKSDFPRIPPPGSRALFAELAAHGARLVALHLMEAAGDDQPAFKVPGANLVDKFRYVAPTDDDPGRVYINAAQHFEGVAPETWQFTIGGYQPAHKWLKDRKGRNLSYDDIRHYQRICAALAEMPKLMSRIDATIDAHGGWPLSAPTN